MINIERAFDIIEPDSLIIEKKAYTLALEVFQEHAPDDAKEEYLLFKNHDTT